MTRPVTALALAATITALAAPAAFAQADITGFWGFRPHEDQPERGPGPDVGEYMGTPFSPASLTRADAWSASRQTVPENQCKPHPAGYQINFQGVRIAREVDPVTEQTIAFNTAISWMTPKRKIWMDGRPHPGPNALHTWEGFSTGHWEADVLVVDTTHLKMGYVHRNGLAYSEKATLREYITRTGDVLTWNMIVYDPAYLTEPFMRNRDYQMEPGLEVGIYPCAVETEIPRAEGVIPHYLPGTNDQLGEFAENFNLPLEATRAGAESMYPEFQSRIVGGYKAPTPARRGAK